MSPPKFKTKKSPAPLYDKAGRRFWFRKRLLFEFGRHAPDEEAILETFEELGWPARIDSPVSGKGGQRLAHKRLSNALQQLNARQSGIQFRLDGTGKGVTWEVRRRRRYKAK